MVPAGPAVPASPRPPPVPKGVAASELARARTLVFLAVLARPGATKRALAEATGLSRGRVEARLLELEGEGLVVKHLVVHGRGWEWRSYAVPQPSAEARELLEVARARRKDKPSGFQPAPADIRAIPQRPAGATGGA